MFTASASKLQRYIHLQRWFFSVLPQEMIEKKLSAFPKAKKSLENMQAPFKLSAKKKKKKKKQWKTSVRRRYKMQIISYEKVR